MKRPPRALSAILICITLLIAASTQAQDQRLNVLFIAIDDLRPELGCYGSEVAVTPHLDALAERSLLFERAYCNYPICGASRASLLSGLYPTATRFVGLEPLDRYEPDAVTLPQAFREAGYTTLSNGKIFHSPSDANERSWSEPAWRAPGGHATSFNPATTARLSQWDRGYITESADVEDNAYPDGQVAERTVADLRRLSEADEPFFLGCGFIRPHLPFYAPMRYWDLYERDELPLANNRFRPRDAPRGLGNGSGEWRRYELGELEYNSDTWHRELLHGYLACVSYVDALVGQVLGELDRLGLADNTIVVVWGDHGFHLGEHNFWGKHNTLDGALRVPLIIHVPDSEAGRTAALVESVDLFPTLCALAGVEAPDTLQGRSFAALFEDPDAAFRPTVHARFNAAQALLTPRYAYTRFGGANGARMLFDHDNDPGENQNIANDPDNRELIEELDRLLDERLRQAESE